MDEECNALFSVLYFKKESHVLLKSEDCCILFIQLIIYVTLWSLSFLMTKHLFNKVMQSVSLCAWPGECLCFACMLYEWLLMLSQIIGLPYPKLCILIGTSSPWPQIEPLSCSAIKGSLFLLEIKPRNNWIQSMCVITEMGSFILIMTAAAHNDEILMEALETWDPMPAQRQGTALKRGEKNDNPRRPFEQLHL